MTSLPPIDASPESDAIVAHDFHNRAMNLFSLGRAAEAREAIDSCCGKMGSMITTQQPSLLSCVTVIISELTSNGRPEYAASILKFISDFASIRLGVRHPLTIFLWCMRASDHQAQLILTEELLQRGITELRRIDAKGLKKLIDDFEYRLNRIYSEQGKVDAALDLMKARAYHHELHFGHFDHETANTIYMIARTHFISDNMVEAKFNFEDVLGRTPHISDEAPNKVWLRINCEGRLAQIYKRLGEDDTAREYGLKCLKGPNTGEEEFEVWWRKALVVDGILSPEEAAE